jgi:hypothetical protein
MAKAKTIRDNKTAVLQASNGNKPDSSNRIVLTDANAPILSAKFLNLILTELQEIHKLLKEKADG